jgi:hypothetical protein
MQHGRRPTKSVNLTSQIQGVTARLLIERHTRNARRSAKYLSLVYFGLGEVHTLPSRDLLIVGVYIWPIQISPFEGRRVAAGQTVGKHLNVTASAKQSTGPAITRHRNALALRDKAGS